MSKLLRSYLKYARGESPGSPWGIIYPLHFFAKAWTKARIGLFGKGVLSSEEPSLPVISVGNNSLGGTNKTPMTELLVRRLSEAGIEAGLICKGYGAKSGPPIWIGQDEESKQREVAGDEPLMLHKRLPDVKIAVAKDRLKGVDLLKSLGVQIAVTDDTFQHRKMARDVDIVLVDATAPFGNERVFPAGMLREPMSSFSRADIVVITKANQVTSEEITATKDKLLEWVLPEKIFTAKIELESWRVLKSGESFYLQDGKKPEGVFIAFSAIGNSDGFYKFLNDGGLELVAERSYRDHHIFTEEDMSNLTSLVKSLGADGLICTEKDLANISDDIKIDVPVYVPSIIVAPDDEPAFMRKVADLLRPRLMVATNGYGEDAIGVVLAKKLRERFKSASISAFALVGTGRHYEKEGFEVLSPDCEMPSGGVIKYSFWELIRDLRHGLGRSIRKQIETLRRLSGMFRTPLCVGDFYLFTNVLWGQGMKPALVATAKSVKLAGHYRVESWILKNRCRRVWARDRETAQELADSGVPAVFRGNPIMDIADEAAAPAGIWSSDGRIKVMLLPGSRARAYDDVVLITEAAKELSRRLDCEFVMVLAPTIEADKIAASQEGASLSDDGSTLVSDGIPIKITSVSVAAVAKGADILIGLGGTANQLCAGFGVPVVSIIEKGKLRQKKLIGDGEILVEPTPEALAGAAEKILTDGELMETMKKAGIEQLGERGALDDVVEYCALELGWDNRCFVYEKLSAHLESIKTNGSAERDNKERDSCSAEGDGAK